MMALFAALTLQQAIFAFEAGKLGEAQGALAQLSRAEPRNASALTWLAAARLENDGDARAAQSLLETSLQLDPGSWRAHMLLGVALAKQIGAVSIFEKLSLAGRLKDELDRAVSLAPDSPDARFALLQFYLHAPRIAGGGAGKAREQAREIGRAHPFEGLIAQGMIAAHQGDDAAPLFRLAAAAAKSDAERARALSDLSQFFRAKKQPADALAAAQAAAAARPGDPLLAAGLAEAQLAGGEVGGAVESLHLATVLDPALAPPWLLLGTALERQGLHQGARAALSRFLELAPQHPRAGEAREKLSALRGR